LGHGFSGTQDRLFDNAGRFAEAGFAALTFDYRSFGESGGEPRQVVSVGGQLEDWRAAIRLARGLEGVDSDTYFAFGLDLLLAGIEAMAERKREGLDPLPGE
jgi:fermentation-respiration switch protein FrsA (DUF1100 family)